MRYQDWDVLLFPSGSEAHTPFKEFRTACYVEAAPNSNTQTPLLSTFVPSLPRGVAFQVSIHSWVPTRPMIGALANGAKIDEAWEARVVVDGKLETVHYLPCQTVWPQIISSNDASALGPQGFRLRFPPFHQDIMLQAGWCAADRRGRIRVELGAGYYAPDSGIFVRSFDVVIFAFQHAPIETLERCGVAWPNGHMLANPIMNPAFFAPTEAVASTKRKAASTSNIYVPTNNVDIGQLAPLPIPNGNMNDTCSNYDFNSRSTSTYSTVPDSAGPLMATALYQPTPAYPAFNFDVSEKPLSFRLPSDQIQKIISALDNKTHAAPAGNTNFSTSMPPPPLPQRILSSNATASQNSTERATDIDPQISPDMDNITNRREQSRFSDVSMHTSCTSFPVCTTEDNNGKIVHASADVPASKVKGKKEGSSAPKRKSSLSTLKIDPTEKKRTRRSTRLLQHDSGYAGGPSDDLDGATGDESDILESSGNQGTKRARAALTALGLSDGSPEKRQATSPARKTQLSASSADEDKENKKNINHEEDMILDA